MADVDAGSGAQTDPGRQADRLTAAALGGRVENSDFLEPDESARLRYALREREVSVTAWGGYPGARRRVLTAFPPHVPHAQAQLAAVFLQVAISARELPSELTARGVPAGSLGDVRQHSEGLSLMTLDPPPAELLALSSLGGEPVSVQVVPIERAAAGSRRTVNAVVASLRVDALGSKAFRVSRSYFAKGVAGGKVSVNGRPAGKSSGAAAGDEIWAEGLGRVTVLSIDGETRRGNVKVSLEVETS